MIYIVGAGPGDNKLLTVRAFELIKRADTIIYDTLASEQILDLVSPECKLFYVGKNSDGQFVPQEQINELLVATSYEDKIVIRLKKGDPFLFERGSEEACFLKSRGIHYEIIPGLSTPLCIPQFAGIPATYRKIAESVHVFSDGADIDSHELKPSSGTLIFLNAFGIRKQICQKLLKNGFSPLTSCALMQGHSASRLKTIYSTIGNLYNETKHMKNPAILVVGDVVKLAGNVSWRQNLPLNGKRILITRNHTHPGELAARLYELGADTYEVKTVSINPTYSKTIDDHMKKLSFEWLFFNSTNAIELFFSRFFELGGDIRKLHGIKICAIGNRTASKLSEYGIKADFVPNDASSGYVASIMSQFVLEGDRIFFPCSSTTSNTLAKQAEKLGAVMEKHVLYENVPNVSASERAITMLQKGKIDAIIFCSGSQIENFAAIAGNNSYNAKVFTIGPATSEKASKLGFNVVGNAKNASLEHLLYIVQQHLGGRKI